MTARTAQPQDSINHVSATEAASNFIKKSGALELAASSVNNDENQHRDERSGDLIGAGGTQRSDCQ